MKVSNNFSAITFISLLQDSFTKMVTREKKIRLNFNNLKIIKLIKIWKAVLSRKKLKSYGG